MTVPSGAMIDIAFAVLTVAVALGLTLAVMHLRGVSPRLWPGGVSHGLAGAIGLGLLLFALKGGAQGGGDGVASFGPAAAILAGAALLLGLIVLFRTSRGRTAGLLIAVHGSLAITAYTLLLAYVSLR
jgi:hypothetical protein